MKIIFTEKGEAEQTRLGVDLRPSIERILQFVPGADIVDLSQLIVTDVPVGRLKGKKIRGSYSPKYEKNPACIEIYLKYIYAHLKTSGSFEMTKPIQEIALAKVLIHEIGHHVKEIRSQGIKSTENEGFAEEYTLKAMDNFFLGNAQSSSECFDRLEKMVDEGATDEEVVKSIRAGWERDLAAARSRSADS